MASSTMKTLFGARPSTLSQQGRGSGSSRSLGSTSKQKNSSCNWLDVIATTTHCFFYLAHCALGMCIGVLLTVWTPGNAMYFAWPTVAYCKSTSWGVNPYCVNSGGVLSSIVHNTGTIYSSIPMWLPIGFACFTTASVYLVAALGEGFIVTKAYKIPDPTDDCKEDEAPLLPEGGGGGEPKVKEEIKEANDYSALVLFFARFCTLPIMSAMVCISLVDKSGASAIGAMSTTMALGWLSYVASALYAWVYIDPKWCKEQQKANAEVSCPDMWSVLSIQTVIGVIGLSWLFIVVSLAYPPCLAYSLVGAETIPVWIKACFGLYLGYLSVMAIYLLYDILCLACAVSGSKMSMKKGVWAYTTGMGLAHVLHSTCAGLFMIFAYQATSTSGYISL